MKFGIVWCAECEGGLQIMEIEDGEDCCAVARRYGGICYHVPAGGTLEGATRTLQEYASVARQAGDG